MCQFLSFFVNRKTLALACGDLRSHSTSAEILGIDLASESCPWREAEWTGETPASLTVRVRPHEEELRTKLLSLVSSRSELLARLSIPAGVTTLYLNGATVPEKLSIPAGVTTLDLSYATVPEKLSIPAGVTTLYLNGATVPEKLSIPAGVTTLDLTGATV